MAFGLDETGLISKACKAAMSPASAKATIWASLVRNRAWVGLEKSGVCGKAPDYARSRMAWRLPMTGTIGAFGPSAGAGFASGAGSLLP